MQSALKLDVWERRSDPRYEAYKNAVIRWADEQVVDCVIENISEGGALLVLDRKRKLPATFKLFVPDNGVEKSCRRIHADGLKVGVAFA